MSGALARPATRVVVVTYNGAHLLPACLDALIADGGDRDPPEIVVVDNASVDGTTALLAERYPAVTVIASPDNTGFAGGVALGLGDGEAPVVVLVNNDAVVEPGFLDAIVAPFGDPRVGAVCAKVVLADDGRITPDGPGTDNPRINSVGAEITTAGYARDRGLWEPDDGRYDRPTEVLVASGSALALRAAAVADAGGIDPTYFLYYEDTDLTWRMRLAGWTVVTAPAAVARHRLSATAVADSPLVAYHFERNRLVTMVKDASIGFALTAVARQPVATARGAIREVRAAHREGRPVHLDIVAARARAFGGFLRLLPHALRERRRTGRRAVVARRDLERRWLVAPG